MSKKQEEQNNINIEEFEKLQAEMQALQETTTSLEGQLKRAVADYHNLEKRVSEGRSELTQWGTTELINKMLVVLDYLEQATVGVSEGEKKSAWFKGVELAVKQFKEVLKSEGLDEIVADGQFDPALHEAVDTAEGENNHILKVTRKGYNLHGKVLRPVQVIVGRELESSDQSQEEEGDGSTGSPNT